MKKTRLIITKVNNDVIATSSEWNHKDAAHLYVVNKKAWAVDGITYDAGATTGTYRESASIYDPISYDSWYDKMTNWPNVAADKWYYKDSKGAYRECTGDHSDYNTNHD